MSTTFTDGSSRITAAWLNAVDANLYDSEVTVTPDVSGVLDLGAAQASRVILQGNRSIVSLGTKFTQSYMMRWRSTTIGRAFNGGVSTNFQIGLNPSCTSYTPYRDQLIYITPRINTGTGVPEGWLVFPLGTEGYLPTNSTQAFMPGQMTYMYGANLSLDASPLYTDSVFYIRNYDTVSRQVVQGGYVFAPRLIGGADGTRTIAAGAVATVHVFSDGPLFSGAGVT